MPLHFMKPIHNIRCYASRMGQSNSLSPEVAGNTVCGYGNLREDTLKELAETAAPPALNLQYEWDKLLLRVLHKEVVLIPLVPCLHD